MLSPSSSMPTSRVWLERYTPASTIPASPTQRRNQKHEPVSYVKYLHKDFKSSVVYRGPNTPEMLVEMLRGGGGVEEISWLYSYIKPMELTEQEEAQFEEMDVCQICSYDIIEDLGMVNIRDHDYLTGTHKGPAHQSCNLNYQNPDFVLVFIHNLLGYHAHLFVRELEKYEEEIDVISNTEEKYLHLRAEINGWSEAGVREHVPIHGVEFGRPTKNLSKDQFRETAKFFPPEKLELLMKKRVYPYDYMSYSNCWITTTCSWCWRRDKRRRFPVLSPIRESEQVREGVRSKLGVQLVALNGSVTSSYKMFRTMTPSGL